MMMKRALQLGSWLPCLVLISCGPGVTPPGSDGSTASDTSPGEDTRSTPPPVTTAATTSPATTGMPGDVSDGSVDTGVLDTGEIPEDCSFVAQDCPAGYKCMPYANDGGVWNDTICVPLVDEPSTVGQPCMVEGSVASGLDNCDGSSMCWDLDPETLEGTCVPFCIGDEVDPYCADRCDFCLVASDFALALCLPVCDPVVQDCDEGQGCYPLGYADVFMCGPDVSDPDVGIGSPCEFASACPAGLVCVESSSVPDCAGASGCCTPACAVGAFDPCPALLPGSVCTPWYGDEPPAQQSCLVSEPGVCVVP